MFSKEDASLMKFSSEGTILLKSKFLMYSFHRHSYDGSGSPSDICNLLVKFGDALYHNEKNIKFGSYMPTVPGKRLKLRFTPNNQDSNECNVEFTTTAFTDDAAMFFYGEKS